MKKMKNLILVICLFSQIAAIGQNTIVKNIYEPSEGMEVEGQWSVTLKNEYVTISLKKEDGSYTYVTMQLLLSELKDFGKDGSGNFVLIREAGVMKFTGKFDRNEGSGHYSFTADKDYADYMRDEHIDIVNEKKQMAFFVTNIKRSYITMLIRNGLIPNKDYLVALAALDVDEAYIKLIKEDAGISDVLCGDFIPFRALKIDKDYIDKLRRAGHKNLTVQSVISFKAKEVVNNPR